MPLIKFNVRNQNLRQYNSAIIAANSQDYLRFKFNFLTEDWKSVGIKTALFVGYGRCYPVPLSSDDDCYVPKSVIKVPGFSVSVFGGGITTNLIDISVVDNGMYPELETLISVEAYSDLIGRIETLTANMPDNLTYDQLTHLLQLSAGNEAIGDPVDLSDQKRYVESLNIQKVAPYLYKADYFDCDYDIGNEYYLRYKPQIGACSAISCGNLFGRNYDWTYDEKVSIIVQTPAAHGRHATLGVASTPFTGELTQQFLDSGNYSDEYKVVPFLLLDGINDAGLICEVNVVPTGDYGLTSGTNPGADDMCALMITRYVLDYASSVDEAYSLLQSKNIYCANSAAFKQEFHIMIADSTKTIEVEFVDNQIKKIQTFVSNKPIVTNFYLFGYNGTRNSLTTYAMGTERYDILAASYDTIDNVNDMINTMKSVWYTKAYSTSQDPIWYSEFVGNWTEQGYGDLTKDSSPSEFTALLQKQRQVYNSRQRDGRTWQTVYTSVYDREARKLYIIPQESESIFGFALPSFIINAGEII